jgi:beta-phosphoglucomutase-like phosphatase (HAD superfamily)
MAPSAKLAFLFDLDGTLIDSVYEHVLALGTKHPSPLQ